MTAAVKMTLDRAMTCRCDVGWTKLVQLGCYCDAIVLARVKHIFKKYVNIKLTKPRIMWFVLFSTSLRSHFISTIPNRHEPTVRPSRNHQAQQMNNFDVFVRPFHFYFILLLSFFLSIILFLLGHHLSRRCVWHLHYCDFIRRLIFWYVPARGRPSFRYIIYKTV